MSIVLSTEAVNRYGFRILTNGLKLDNFRKNPVMLLEHGKQYPFPIGKWENVRVEGTQLLGDPVFDENDQMALLMKKKFEGGFMNTASVGVIPLSKSENPDLLLPGQYRPTVTSGDVFEITLSIVPVNQEAVRLSLDEGQKMEDYLPRITLSKSNDMLDLSKIAAKLALSANANEAAILAAIDILNAKVLGLEKDRVEALMSYGEKAGLIDEASRKNWETLAQGNYLATKGLLENSKPIVKSPDAKIGGDQITLSKAISDAQGQGEKPKDSDDRENWTYDDYQKKDSDALLALKRNNPKKYEELALAYEKS